MKTFSSLLVGLLVFGSPIREDFRMIGWPSPMPFPKGAEKFRGTKWTQSIYRLNSADTIDKVPISELEGKWHQSGGLEGITGWSSHKYRVLPMAPKTWVGTISILNKHGSYQGNQGIRRTYADGTEFHDILVNGEGICFEHRRRMKRAGKWKSSVIYRDVFARPTGYAPLTISCSSCHDEAGTGKYGVGLVPGGDTVLSDPLDWSIARHIGGTR